MSKENLVIFENIDSDVLSSFVLDQLSDVVATNSDIKNTKLIKGTTENTKSEINLALEILISVGTSIVGAVIYDYLKKIFKSIGKKQKCRFKVIIGEAEDNIEIYFSEESNDVVIEIIK